MPEIIKQKYNLVFTLKQEVNTCLISSQIKSNTDLQFTFKLSLFESFYFHVLKDTSKILDLKLNTY